MTDRPADTFRSPRAIALFFGTTIIGMTIDLWTKSLAATRLRHGGSVDVITDWLVFKYTENFGAVFGLGQGQRPLFIIVSIGAIAFLTYLFAVSGRRWFYQLLLGFCSRACWGTCTTASSTATSAT